MNQIVRQSAILEALASTGSCSVRDLASRLGVSGETVRRDLKRLAGEGLVRKVHGGVVPPEPQMEPGFHDRLMQHAGAKRAIAQSAAALVRDGDSLMLDTGSTTAYVARALRRHRNLLVVTNSADIARTLATRNGNQVYMAGGEFRSDDGAALGPSAVAFVEQFRVRLAFLSIGAVDLDDGLMDFHLAEAEFSRAVIRRAEHRVVVADRSKFGRRAVVAVCPLSVVDTLITDAPPPSPFLDQLQKADTALIAPERGTAD